MTAPPVVGVGLYPFPPVLLPHNEESASHVAIGFMTNPRIVVFLIMACACDEPCGTYCWHVLWERNVYHHWNDGSIEVVPYSDETVH